MVLLALNFRRSSLAHGTPPHIDLNYFDTPIPTLEDLRPPNSDITDEIASQSFVALCTLSCILGSTLRQIYRLTSSVTYQNLPDLQALKSTLEEWKDNLPITLKKYIVTGSLFAQGTLNLRLAYLALNQLLARLSLDVSSASGSPRRPLMQMRP